VRFADTSFWIALQVPRDEHHSVAKCLWETDSDPVLTTNHVVGETWTFLRRRADHRTAVGFYQATAASPRLRIDHVPQDVEMEAWSWLLRHDEREYSFVDATSFAVMRRRRVRHALAFDGDFAAAGFIELR